MLKGLTGAVQCGPPFLASDNIKGKAYYATESKVTRTSQKVPGQL